MFKMRLEEKELLSHRFYISRRTGVRLLNEHDYDNLRKGNSVDKENIF